MNATLPVPSTAAITDQQRKDLFMRLRIAVGPSVRTEADECLVDGLFELMSRASKHTIAHVLAVHGESVTELMKLPYASR